jgi:metal-sulfur cluster biosynthetic enzyme
MTLTSPACPVGPEIVALVQTAVEAIEEVDDAKVELVWEPMWDPKTMASDDAKDLLGIW